MDIQNSIILRREPSNIRKNVNDIIFAYLHSEDNEHNDENFDENDVSL